MDRSPLFSANSSLESTLLEFSDAESRLESFEDCIETIKELQHEVSSLLEFKNALLETFPHLQGKLGHSHSQPRLHQSYNTSPPSSTARTSSSTLREHDSPLRSPNVSSAERLSAPGAVGGGRQIQHVHDSDEIPGSWNGSTGVGTLPRSGNHRGQKIRKSPEGSSAGSNIVDSGFSTETTKDISSSGTSTLLASNSSGGRAMNSHPNYAMDVRWDTWEQGPSHSHQPAEDELQFLLDVIHRKSVRLRRDLDGKTLELSLAQNQAHDPSHYQDATRSMAGTPRRLQPQIPLTPAGPQKGLRVISEHDASDNTLHGPLGGGHQPVINTSGNEVELLRRERELLMRRIAHLESENADFSVRMGGGVIDHKGGGEIFHLARTKGARGSISQNPNLSDSKGSEAPEGNAQDGGIVHSVQIRTGGVGELRRAQSVSGDANGNGAAPIGPDQHGVNIEIKQQRHARYSHPSPRAPLPGSGGISVVNLRGSVDNLLPHTLNSSGNPSSRSYSFNELSAAGRHRTNSFGTQQKLGHRPKVIPSRIVVPPSGNSAQAKISPQLNRVLSNKNLNPKSKSVENLVDGAPILGLKNANSEMNVYRGHPGVGHSKFPHPATTATQSQRLRGTTSELNMSRLGANEKLRFDTMEGILSMPVELTRGLKSQVKPNREKIRQVINMNNVIDLQRQLLTTVMENEVYKTQLERLSENWTEKIGDIERANGSLHHEVEHLRVENEELKIKVNKKLIELESAKAKLKVLEKNQFDGGVKGGGNSRNLPVAGNFSKTDLVSKNENRVHFDLHSTPKSPGAPTATKVVQADPSAVPARTAGTQGPSGDGGLRSGNTTGRRGMIHHSQLPSDTRQRLEEMANSASGSAKKYSNARSGDPVQDLIASRFNFPAGNNLVTTSQPLGIPTTATLSKPTVAPSSRRGDPSATPLSNNNRERSLNDKNIETTKVNTVPSHGHSSAGGGVSQTINNLNNNGTTPLPTSTMNHFSSISNDPSKKDPASPALISSPAQVVLTERDLKTMGRDTIAGLIAGILQKYSHKKEDSMPPPLPPREAFVPSPSTELVPTKMSPEIAHLAGSRTSMLSTPTGGNSSMKKISWEANNGLEEVTHMALQRHAATPQLGNLPETPSP
ncbi:uncharacterized protein LOC131891447 isoform X2 [Tigriopus californicus]|uniref:uncharacterized protein LOC131891447 isoform X2 n=1 Tax=Tigriopus californicus TaxID=6832 RepID=UPI0027DA74B9|nr:uncharacterized protein LOC131891447 isoform X2 [Tigriopus californicus]